MTNDDDGITQIVKWVRATREECARKGTIFDTLLRCESEGGEVFVFDPERLEDLVNERDALLVKVNAVPCPRCGLDGCFEQCKYGERDIT